jgi:hypothetical protein
MNGVGTTGTTGTTGTRNELTLVNFHLVAELKLGATYGRHALIKKIDDQRERLPRTRRTCRTSRTDQ